MSNQSELFRLVSLSSSDPKYEYMAAELFITSLENGEGQLTRKRERRTTECIIKIKNLPVPEEVRISRNRLFKYFGIQTLARSYLINDETPQELYMRVSVTLFKNENEALEYYDALSCHRISNATPIMLNCGTNMEQLNSCFQINTADDLASLFDTVKTAGMTSKWSGGISINISEIRAEGTLIKSTGGICTGTKRLIQLFNYTQLYVDQGGNRPGAIAVYQAVDHADILTFLGQSLLKGEAAYSNVSAPDLKYAMWVSDLFMEKLYEQLTNPNDPTAGDWYLFCPSVAPGLNRVYGDEYRELYNRYVEEKKYVRKIKTRDVIEAAFKAWTQMGTPYVLFKDAINMKSNMKNVAPIQSSNLCCEITIPSWNEFNKEEYAQYHPDNAAGGETGVCTLGAISLEKQMTEDRKEINWTSIINDAKLECTALNNVIDVSRYPDETGKRSSRRHRPIGLGIMGLADVLANLKLAYDSQPARDVAQAIAATIYYGALVRSCELAKLNGPYASYMGSPMSQGLLQPDMWNNGDRSWEATVAKTTGGVLTSDNWNALRADISKYGIRNAYLIAYMPTATTSNVVGQNECFEPFTSNIYTRKTQAGEFTIVNKHLVCELKELGLWNEELKDEIIGEGGSVQTCESIPQELRLRYKTSRELSPLDIIEMCSVMAPFICQSMSMNLFLNEPSLPKILKFLIAGWRKGLKTGMYYCHTRPASGSQKNKKKNPSSGGGSAAEEGCAACSI